MIIRLIACFVLVSALALASAEKFRYDDYHVISVNIENEQQRELVERLDGTMDGVQLFDTAVVNGKATLIIGPHQVASINNLFSLEGLAYEVGTSNLQKLIDDEQPKIIPRRFGWTAYYPLGRIYAWLNEKIREYPRLLTNYNIGTTVENRPIRAVRLSHRRGNPTIFIESTTHAREWITVATTTYFLNELLTSRNATIRNLARNYDWVIIPVLNPDGYEFSHTNDRFWRKNRQRTANAACRGIDLNRNFDVSFGGVGSSNDPCSQTYRGPRAMSERESSSLSRFIDRFRNTRLYLSFHSSGQLLMYPFSYKRDRAPNHNHLDLIGRRTVAAISRRFSSTYRVGPGSTVLSPVSGDSVDWAYENKNISLSYTFEFRPRFGGVHVLPPDQIIPNSLEIIDGIVAMVSEARRLNYFRN